MDNKKRFGIQAVATLIQNCNLKGFFTGEIYKGQVKNVCVPGINCYSCPGAVASCPIGALQNALSASRFKFPFYVVGILIFLGALLGRLICGFLCPFGFLQDLLYRIPFYKKIKTFKGDFVLRKIKWIVLILFVVILPVCVKLTPFFCKYICPSGTIAGLLLSFGNSNLFALYGNQFVIKACILVTIVLTGIIIYRPFCKYLCPLGLIYGWFNKVSLVQMRCDSSSCIHCGKCEEVCEMGVNPSISPNNSECIRCTKCVDECPNKSLTLGIQKLKQE